MSTPVTDSIVDHAYEAPHTPSCDTNIAESIRLRRSHLREENWQRWGTYLPERQWGTVREDYSADGDVWVNFPFEQAHKRAYRWGDDGLLGWTDRECRLCFSLALWNGEDPILKERLFGLTGHQGNHGEDVKELYYYLDASPCHTYAKALYKYPQAEYPYQQLLNENAKAGFKDLEYEIVDTGVFDKNRYWDVTVEYAKGGPDDILIAITVQNRGDRKAEIHLLPTLFFRNSWSWACDHEGCSLKPRMTATGDLSLVTEHEHLEVFDFAADQTSFSPDAELIFCDNETDHEDLYGQENTTPYTKQSFHKYVIDGEATAVNPKRIGTKAALYDRRTLSAGESVTLRMRLKRREGTSQGEILSDYSSRPLNFGDEFDATLASRISETNDFYDAIIPQHLTDDERRVARQAYAGLLWTKQFYQYIVKDWLDGDPNEPPPVAHRGDIRNGDWKHLFNRDVISMPDKWEYPWYALWDSAFHMVVFAKLDPYFAKEQLVLFCREWYMHPNGQLPAYEWDFGDVNPPVHAWATWRVYKLTAPRGERDQLFLARMFHKLLLNFTWWVNRKDANGDHLFSGGFLGLDNIGVFDRSEGLPSNAELEQADGTAWMAFYCSTMLEISIELAVEQPEYEGVASKFFEHFVEIADAMNTLGGTGLWDKKDGFYYDHMHVHGQSDDVVLRTRSLVGLVPLFAVLVLEAEDVDKLPNFKKRMEWFLRYRGDLSDQISYFDETDEGGRVSQPPQNQETRTRRLLAIPSEERLRKVLAYAFDENEFLSPYGIRSMSKYHADHPFRFDHHCVAYVPGESDSGLFGGNSNWRGPVWLPMNYLFIEALERYHYFYGDDFRVEYPTGSGNELTLKEIADDLAKRLCKLFLADEQGKRPSQADDDRYAEDPAFKDLVLFYEYFHGDTGRGLGASHQTGWTALVANLLSR